MKTITKTYNIYEFDELPQDIRQKVIEKEAENLREAEIEDFLEEEIKMLAIQLLEENFEEKAVFRSVCYSLNCCQGDGVCVEFDLNYCNELVRIRHDGGHYFHKYSFSPFYDDLTSEQWEELEEKIIKINEDLERYGYEFIGADRTEQAIEQLKDCMFYENGDIY